MTNLVKIADDYFRISRELKYAHSTYLVTKVSEFFGELVRLRADELGVTAVTTSTLSGSYFTAVYRDGLVDIYLHWGMRSSFLNNFEDWNPHYCVKGLSPDIIRILSGEARVDHYGELQWMLNYFRERGVWTTPNQVELAKSLTVLKSLSSQLTLSGREWYVWSEDGSSKITVFSLSYDADLEAFFIMEEYVDDAIETLQQIALDQNINIENEPIVSVCRMDNFLHFEL